VDAFHPWISVRFIRFHYSDKTPSSTKNKFRLTNSLTRGRFCRTCGQLSCFLSDRAYLAGRLFLICFVGFFISLVARRSIGAAGKANETILKVFEEQFGVQPAFGAPGTVLVANKLILPTIAGGGDHQNIPRGFLSARWIPVFLMSGWVFSLLFDAWVIWYARM
jgi:hypothetical protein